MGEYAVAARGLGELVQRLLFAIVFESPGTLSLLDRHWVSAERQQCVGYPIGHKERVKECMKLTPSLFLI